MAALARLRFLLGLQSVLHACIEGGTEELGMWWKYGCMRGRKALTRGSPTVPLRASKLQSRQSVARLSCVHSSDF